TRSPSARREFNQASDALQFVPPQGKFESFATFVITLSRGFNGKRTTSLSNGITSAVWFFRNTADATRAATSTHRTAVVDPRRNPVTGDCIDPDTSGHT